MESPYYFMSIEIVTFDKSIHESSSESYYLASLNSIFHGLSFGIKFMISPTEYHSVTPLE
jgi:hypothetical protein